MFVALIIVGASSLGGFLRDLAPPIQPPDYLVGKEKKAQASRVAEATSAPQPAAPRQSWPAATGPVYSSIVEPAEPLNLAPRGEGDGLRLPMSLPKGSSPALASLHASAAPRQRVDWFGPPDLKRNPPRKIAPLQLIPEPGGVLGLLARAVNLLLAYFVSYQPRLFLAAVLAGGWIGWCWHRHLQQWQKATGTADGR